MLHQMRLDPEPFEKIKSGKKTIEIRLFDEKRRALNINDQIQFFKLPNLDERMIVNIDGLSIFKTFKDLFLNFRARAFGHDGKTLKEQLDGVYETYSKEREEKWGVLGIHISLEEERVDKVESSFQ